MTNKNCKLATVMYMLTFRALQLGFRQRSDALNPLLFFILIGILFPFGVGPDQTQLSTVGIGVIIISALLSILISSDRLFKNDFDEGYLQYLLTSPQPLAALLTPTLVVHWLTTGVPLVLLSPLLAIMFYLPITTIPAIMLSLLLATPLLTLLGAIAAALTVGLKKGGVLIPLLTLPLNIPVLILTASCIRAASIDLPWHGYLWWLATLLMLGITFAPFAIASALRISYAD